MDVIYILLRKLSAGLGISVQVIIICVLHMKKIAHLCCLPLVYSLPDSLVICSESKILQSSIFVYLE